MPSSKKTGSVRSPGRESSSASRKRRSRRSLRMRRKSESFKSVRLSCRDRGRLNSTVRSKKSWNSSDWLNSKGVWRPNRRKKRLKPSRKSSSVRLRRFSRLSRGRSREGRERWTARTKRGDSAWRRRISERRKRVRSSDSRSRPKLRK